MIKTICVTVLILMSTFIFGQVEKIPNDIQITEVNKKVKEFPDIFDNSSPLMARVTVSYIWINGTNGKYHDIKPERVKLFNPANAPNEVVSAKWKDRFLNSTILEILIYKDSIAGVITQTGDSSFTIEQFEKTDNKWWYLGGDPYNSKFNCREQFFNYSNINLLNLRRAIQIAKVPADTLAFVNYLKKHSSPPEKFLLKKLNETKLVIYGEIHRRKASWDLLIQIANNKKFPNYVGTVFMEMASHKQSDIDKFVTSDTMDYELLLNVFRDYMTFGWLDKGMFDFIENIRKINQKLPDNHKIRVIAVDTPRPFNTFNSKEDIYKNARQYDRDEFMANAILSYLSTNQDKRHSLFIVGTAHVCKSLRSAGKILSDSLPASYMYSVFTHSPITDNFIDIPLRIRHGVFDYAFSETGNIPLAFELKNSPFGKEAFDAFYFEGNGLFQDNYDGYIFFGPLDTEPQGDLLLDIYSETFISEINRRLSFDETNIQKEWNLKDSSRESVIESVQNEFPKRKWDFLPPMKNQ